MWKCYFVSTKTGRTIGHMHTEPECGEDFCDFCGDCLYCYGDDECLSSPDGRHRWVIYVDSEEEAREIAEERGTKFVADESEQIMTCLHQYLQIFAALYKE